MKSPKQFWRLHPDEFWWLWDVNQPRTKYGNMTQAEAKGLYERTLRNAKNRQRRLRKLQRRQGSNAAMERPIRKKR